MMDLQSHEKILTYSKNYKILKENNIIVFFINMNATAD